MIQFAIFCFKSVLKVLKIGAFRAIDTLLNQMSLNMDEVSGLRQGLEDRISKHVDVREALLKKKDEQLQGETCQKFSTSFQQ